MMARRGSGRTNVGARSPFTRDTRPPFEMAIHNGELAQVQQWVLRHSNIETGGDLFGLWSTENTAVVQLVLGPGKRSRRTTTSFYQDARYLGEVGSRLTKDYGLCHIGEWHSHHTLGLAHPSSGDQSTVWRHMPSNGFKRFIVCIANIDNTQHSRTEFSPTSKQEVPVGLGCFLFEVKDTHTWQRYDMLQGRFDVISGQSPFRELPTLCQIIETDAESVNSTGQVYVRQPWTGSQIYNTGNKGTNILLYQKSGGTSIPHRTAVINRNSDGLRRPPSSRTTNASVKSPSERNPLTSARSRSSLLGTSAKSLDKQAQISTVLYDRQTGTGVLPLWDKLLSSQKLFLEELTHELTGQQINEQWAVTVNFKVRLPRRSDLACRLVYLKDEQHGYQLRLYTSGIAVDYSLIDINMYHLEKAIPTVRQEMNEVIKGVVAQMPFTYTPNLRSGTNRDLQQCSSTSISRADARVRKTTGVSSYGAPRSARRGRSSPVVGTSATSRDRPNWR